MKAQKGAFVKGGIFEKSSFNSYEFLMGKTIKNKKLESLSGSNFSTFWQLVKEDF